MIYDTARSAPRLRTFVPRDVQFIHSQRKKMECSERKEKFTLYAAVRQYLVDGLVDAALKKKVSRMAANFVIRGKWVWVFEIILALFSLTRVSLSGTTFIVRHSNRQHFSPHMCLHPWTKTRTHKCCIVKPNKAAKSLLSKHCLSITESTLFYTGPSAQFMRLVVLSEEQRRAVLEECHNNPGTGNHGGVRATMDRVVVGYYWDSIKADVADWVLFWNSLGI